MRLIDADALKDLMVEVLTNIKNNPRMDGQEKHIIAAMSMLGEMIDDAPTVEPERKPGRWIPVTERKPGRWIPVTERMPEEDGLYLATADACGDRYRIFRFWTDGRWFFSDEDIIAWMPLPEPWEGGQ